MSVKQMKQNRKQTAKQSFVSKHATIRKGPGKATVEQHFLNLRCPNEDCNYLAKTTNILLEVGRLRCPVHHTILRTKDERGETRGRHHAAA